MKSRELAFIFRDPVMTPESRGATPPNYSRTVENGMVIERDIPVMMRDGVRIYIDLFRPEDEKPAPPLIAWSPYGKHVSTSELLGKYYPNSGVNLDELSSYTTFEAPDPTYWVPVGYAVIVANIRGTWYSEGNATFVSPKEAEDYYDLIEWAGTQPWSNGKVGLSGVSYLTVSQWRVAELNPPHLAAINPFEGWTDTYREVVYHGGIPDTCFWPYIQDRWGASIARIEDLALETEEHPFYDEFWASKTCDFSKIRVPAYIVASWSDQGLHSRGTLEGYKRILSEQKWLEVHGRKKWAYYYDPKSVIKQQEFFDHFLKGKPTSINEWPKVSLEVRERFYVGEMRAENEWPLARTQYTKIYLDAETGTMCNDQIPKQSSYSYDALGNETNRSRAQFEFTFEETTQLVGHMKLKIFASSEGSEDMDIFVAIQKIDATGNIVPFAYYAQFEDGPIAVGWLRASHRELDEELSTEFQPILKHRREIKLNQGEIVPLEIEIWPSGTRFEVGEKLRLIIQGSDIYHYPKHLMFARHENTVNKGNHVIHTGGVYDSHLLIPVIPNK